MFLVGLTGGIATGKSTVSSFLQECGAPIIDADAIARAVVQRERKAWRKIREAFGDGVLDEDGNLNREKIGQIIFHSPSERRKLNAITHPEIYKLILWKVLTAFVTGHQFVVLDLPLLYETRGLVLPFLNCVVVVSCDEGIQKNRLKTRNSLSDADADARIQSQMPLKEKTAMADHVIDNNHDLRQTKEQVLQLYEKLTTSNAHWRVWIFLISVTLCLTAFGMVVWRLI